MSTPAYTLQRRLMWAFGGYSLFVAALFGLYALVFMYTVEDAFFDVRLAQESERQMAHHAQTGRWAVPADAATTLHRSTATFPDDLQATYEAEPGRREFAGRDGRHYHLRPVDPPAPARRVWLVSEVSAQLVTRPWSRQIFTLLAVSGAMVVLIALLIGFVLARRTARPLSRLATLVDGMSPDRAPHNIAQDFRNDEVGILARGLDALIGRVHQFVAREQEFTRDASHELRTPLAVIRSAVERLIDEPGLSVAGRDHLQHVRQSALQLEQTVTTLLALAREDACDDDTRRAHTALVPILERIILEQSPRIDGRNVSVELAVPDGTRMAYPAAVVHILLSNLVGNAFAHTTAGDVRIEVVDDCLRIINSADTQTPTIPWPASQPYSKREGSGGFGLGLAIVRRLCDRYGIDLRIDSTDRQVICSVALCPACKNVPDSAP